MTMVKTFSWILITLMMGCSSSQNIEKNDPKANLSVLQVSTFEDNPIAQNGSIPCNPNGTQIELNQCAADRAKFEDDLLNRVYQELRSYFQENSAQEQRLINAQLKWISFRDADCEYAMMRYEGGSIAPLIYHNCIAERTKERTDQLREYLDP